MPLLRAFFALLATSLLAFAIDTLSLEGPEGVTKAELDQCAAALGKRLAAYGLKGLTVGAVEKDGKRRVDVVSQGAIDAETRGKIEFLALYAAQNPAMRFGSQLTDEEKKQGFDYPNPSDVQKAKCPKGASWAECLGDDFKTLIGTSGGGRVAMLKENPWISWSDVTLVSKGDTEWTFKVSAAATKVATAAMGTRGTSRPDSAVTRIAFDHRATLTEVRIALVTKDKGTLKEGTFALPAALAAYVEATLRYPMPKGLKPAAEAEKK